MLAPLSGGHLPAPACSFGISKADLPSSVNPGLLCGAVTQGTESPARQVSLTLHNQDVSGAEGQWEVWAETPSLWHLRTVRGREGHSGNDHGWPTVVGHGDVRGCRVEGCCSGQEAARAPGTGTVGPR